MIDYDYARNTYRPEVIKTLLIGEAPPPNGKTFFYIPKPLNLYHSIDNDTSLPATIFNHYFGERPSDINEYQEFLEILKENGIFLIDILDEPIKIRGNKANENYLISKIPNLRYKIHSLDINIPEDKWIFLLARNSYKKWINKEYPLAKKIVWKEFRLSTTELIIK